MMHLNINNSVSFSLFGVKGSSAINGSLPKASISSIRYYDFCFLSISLTKPFSNALIASLDEDKKPNFQKYHEYKIFIIDVSGWRELFENNIPD